MWFFNFQNLVRTRNHIGGTPCIIVVLKVSHHSNLSEALPESGVPQSKSLVVYILHFFMSIYFRELKKDALKWNTTVSFYTQPAATLFLSKSIWTRPQITFFFHKWNCFSFALRLPSKCRNCKKLSKLKKNHQKTLFS